MIIAIMDSWESARRSIWGKQFKSETPQGGWISLYESEKTHIGWNKKHKAIKVVWHRQDELPWRYKRDTLKDPETYRN